MIVKFCYPTNPSKNILKEIDKAWKLGFDGVEIDIEGPKNTLENLWKRKQLIRKKLQEYNLIVLGHTTYWMNLGCVFESVRKAWVSEVKKTLELCKEIGIEKLNVHAPRAFGFYRENKKEVLDLLIKSLEELIKTSKTIGIGIMIENTPKEEIFFNDLKYVLAKVEHLGFHLDVGHAFVEGGMRMVYKYIREFLPRTWHIHMHDNSGKKDEHLPIGRGKINYKNVVRLLKKYNYERTVSLEIFKYGDIGIKSSLKKLKWLWK